MQTDPFRVLGIAHDAAAQAVEDAWRARMRELHPDANPNVSEREKAFLTERSAEVNAAVTRLRADLEGERARHAPRSFAVSEPPALLPVRIPGGDLFRRPLTWILLAVAAVAALVILNEAGTPQSPRGPLTSTSLTVSPGWSVGSCVAGDTTVVPVRCSDEHAGRIVAQTGAEEYCPEAADGAVFRNNVYFCVDLDA